MISTIESKLQHAFQLGLHLPAETNCESMEFAKSTEWDSIAHLQLIAAIEEEFAITIETRDMLAIDSYAKAREIVGKYGVAPE